MYVYMIHIPKYFLRILSVCLFPKRLDQGRAAANICIRSNLGFFFQLASFATRFYPRFLFYRTSHRGVELVINKIINCFFFIFIFTPILASNLINTVNQLNPYYFIILRVLKKYSVF